MDHTKSFGGIAVCFSGGGCDFIFWCLGVCCTNGLDFFFFFDLTIDDGMGPKLCLMDGWMGKDDMCLSYLLTLLNARVKTDIINQSNQSNQSIKR